MKEQDLQILSRQELQKLARTHDVKANSKSTVIIKQLLGKFPEGVPRSLSPSKLSKRKPEGESRTPSPVIEESHVKSLPAIDNSATPSSILSPPPHSPRVIIPLATADADANPLRPWPPAPLMNDRDEDHPDQYYHEPGEEGEQEDPNAPSEYTHETDATPPSSRANSPQPPCSPTIIKHAVETMRQVSEKDSVLSAQVENLGILADNLTHQVIKLSQVLRRERGMRQRIMTFMTYFIPNNNRWGNRVQNGEIISEEKAAALREEYLRNGGRGWKDQGRWEFEEIWGGPFKYAQNPLPDEDAPEWTEVEEGNEQEFLNLRALAKEAETKLHNQKIRNDIWRKRFREHDDDEGEDETRHRPRRRLQAVEQLATENLVGLRVADKGKGRMTSDEEEDQQNFSGLLEVDPLEMEERLARERMDLRIASRLAAEEYDREDQNLERQAAIRQVKDEAAHNSRELMAAIRLMVMKAATNIVSGVKQWDSGITNREVFRFSLDRLRTIDAEDAAKLETLNLVQVALGLLAAREER